MRFISKLMLVACLIGTLVFPGSAFATTTYSVAGLNGPYSDGGFAKQVSGYMTLSGTYTTGGFTFTPRVVGLSHIDQLVLGGEDGMVFVWSRSTGKVLAYHSGGFTPAGTVASTFTGTPDTISPTASSDTPTITVTNADASAGTPAGTNAASAVLPTYIPDWTAVVKPVITLTHAADPSDAGTDGPLYVVEALAGASANCGSLESTCSSAADVIGETADGSIWGGASSARFFVTHSAAPGGVQIYVNESESDQLECVSPTAEDVFVVMPMEAVAGAPRASVAVRIHHSATAASGAPLYFNDNGAADEQLVFTDTGAVGGVIPAADILPLVEVGTTGLVAGFGEAAAQAFTGSAMGNHSHANTASLDSAPTITVTGASYTPAGSVASTFTGSAVSAASLAEVENGVSMSGVTRLEFIAIGQ
jgi:hypothetical protein